mgnify:FL=1
MYSLFLFLEIETLVFVKIFLLFLFITLSGLVSGGEVAFFSLSPSYIKKITNSKSKSERIIADLRNNPRRLLAVILLMDNLFNIAAVLIFWSLTNYLFISISNVFIQFILEVGLITAIVLIFGEILPKVYGNKNAKSFARKMAWPIYFFDRYVFFFFTFPMGNITYSLQKKLGKTTSNISVDHLSQALELTDKKATTKDEQKILKGIVTFGNTETKQIMCPRIDLFALDKKTKLDEIVVLIKEMGFSRVPVYEDTIDKIVGILYIKDLLPHLDKKSFNWNKLIREPYFVPENKKLDDLLSDFQSKRIHLAVVVDEYGGTSGVISLDDVIEQIVGEISDEFDEYDVSYSKLNSNTFVFDGKTSLRDFYKILKIDKTQVFENLKGESETLAGFLLEQLGSFPQKNSICKFQNLTFTVESVDRKRIRQIKVQK